MTTTVTIRLKRWEVKVFQDGRLEAVNYIVIAADGMDAKTIAFCMDGGFASGLTEMEGGHIELIKMHTKILSVSSA